jgi:hypothetical protein
MKPPRSYEYVDPMRLKEMLWPQVYFCGYQRDIIYSVADNDETFVVAGNMLGKDFTAAFCVLWFFLSRTPCRIVTTSADYSQLEAVLWGEMRRFIQTSKVPLEIENGGPLLVNHLHLRKTIPASDPQARIHGAKQRGVQVCGISYCIGRVAAKGEGMLGHHVAETGDGTPRTMFVADEASGVDDVSYDRADTWAKRKLIIGNPYPCNSFFKRGIQGGDIVNQ